MRLIEIDTFTMNERSLTSPGASTSKLEKDQAWREEHISGRYTYKIVEDDYYSVQGIMTTKAEDLMELGREIDKDDDVMNGLLGAIFAQQENDAQHFQNLQGHWWAESRAKLRIMQDGIAQAMNECGFGGTSADYEKCLSKIAALSYPTHEVLEYYKAKELEHGPFKDYEPHPSFSSAYWEGYA